VSLISDITSIITGLFPEATFTLSSKFSQNHEAFTVSPTALPLIILDNELTKTAEIKKNNNVQKDTRLLISVYGLDSSDNTDAQSQAIQETMEGYADQIAAKIWRLDAIRPISGNNQKWNITPIFRAFGSMLTGVTIDMKANYNEIVNM
jgi:hypothetical protein